MRRRPAWTALIIVDLPPEESDMLLPFAKANGLDFIRLVAPTTDDARLKLVMKRQLRFRLLRRHHRHHRHAQRHDRGICRKAIPRIRKATDLPIAIGFGVRTPAQAAEASRIADAAVVASALIETLSHHLDEHGHAKPGAAEIVLAQVRELAEAVRGAQAETRNLDAAPIQAG